MPKNKQNCIDCSEDNAFCDFLILFFTFFLYELIEIEKTQPGRLPIVYSCCTVSD